MRTPVSEERSKMGEGGSCLPPEPPNGCAQHALRVPARVGTFNRYSCWRLLLLLAPQEGDGQLSYGA
jgi:hypothetical protein